MNAQDRMLIHHRVVGTGQPPIVFVHGFGCARADWDAQVTHLSPRHRTIAVDLRGHGETPGSPADCTIERYGADVAELMRTVALPPSVLVGHSMGCRVVIEAALQAPAHTAALILIDGSQFAPAMEATLKERFAAPGGYATTLESMFRDMFTPQSDRAKIESILERALRLASAVGASLLLDMLRYDVVRLASSLATVRVPILVAQSTYSNERRERRSLRLGQSSPYLDMVKAALPSARIEIIPDTGHFPQIDVPVRTNALIDSFVSTLPMGRRP
jgi:pimeloyl-ACP methyl ester carboxylesterase